MNREVRWNSIFQPDGRALIVALDHTFPMGIAPGWEHPAETLEKLVAGGPDAILTHYGVIKQFSSLLAPEMGLIVRLDGGAPYGEEWNKYTEWRLLHTVEGAEKLGAHGVICNFLMGSPTCELASLQIAARVAEEAAAAGMAFTVEAFPIPGESIKDEYDVEVVARCSRLGAEIGADMIKTLYPRTRAAFEHVTATCPVPVLIAGGDPAADRDLLTMMSDSLDAGGKGGFVGRNIWQHGDPTRIIRALRKVMHEGASVEVALEELDEVVA